MRDLRINHTLPQYLSMWLFYFPVYDEVPRAREGDRGIGISGRVARTA